jgi:PAS domain S-box-containing protein
VWADGDYAENFEYDLTGTPCANVVKQKFRFYPENIQAIFPEDQLLVDLEAESYMGTPLIDSSGRAIGVLAALDDKPMEDFSFFKPTMAMIAIRVIAEIERNRAQEELNEYRQHLEELVEKRTVELKKANIKLRQEITERKQAEEILQLEKQRLDNVSKYANCGLFLLDEESRITYANKLAEEWFGPLEQIMGKPCWKVFNHKDPDKECACLKVLRTEKTARSDTFTELLQGEKKYFNVIASPVRDTSGKIHQVSEIVIDITERKKVEKKLRDYQKKLRSLTSELSLAEEQERRRIATDLHDYIGQSLAISKIKLRALQDEASSADFSKSLKEIQKLVDQAIKYARSLMSDLSPPILYELGFEAAVEWLAEKIYKQHGILCSFEDDRCSKPLDDEVRVVLFQAVRELLINIAKHGQARNANVLVKKNGNKIRIDVEDDGVGFDRSKVSFYGDDTGGFGLFNIRERLDYLGGHLRIKSKPGHGTRVTLTAPLKSVEGITKKKVKEEYVI